MKQEFKTSEFYLLYVYHENTKKKKKIISKMESRPLNTRSPCTLLQHMSYAFVSQELKTKSNWLISEIMFYLIILIGLTPTMSSHMHFTNTA